MTKASSGAVVLDRALRVVTACESAYVLAFDSLVSADRCPREVEAALWEAWRGLERARQALAVAAAAAVCRGR